MHPLGNAMINSGFPPESSAKATAVHTPARPPHATNPGEGPGLGRVHRRFWTLLLITWVCKLTATAQTLSLPPRPASALTASQLATHASFLTNNLVERDDFIRAQILAGNVPDFLRQLIPVTLTNVSAGQTNIATIYVTPNYLAFGHDADYLLMPLAPQTAQRIAAATGCLLPTRRMVDAIYARAPAKLPPHPLPPDARMRTVPVFLQHNEIIRTQLLVSTSSPSTLIAGHKKDIVITPQLATTTNKVAIYGWHRTNGVAIQPLYLGHTTAWVDYSHGIRLVSQHMLLNGQPTNVTAILSDINLCSILSDEGVLTQPRYPTDFHIDAPPRGVLLRWPQNFYASNPLQELTRELNLPNGVRIVINTPAEIQTTRNQDGALGSRPSEASEPGPRPALQFNNLNNKPLLLVFFALPNGNTTEWTIGKKMQPGDDWHFNIQHIGAQTRFLRNVLTNQTIVVAYLENSLKSWPAWRRQHGNDGIPALLNTVRSLFANYQQEIVLTGHSGGGSLTFGYLNAVPVISRDIKRIAFLDSNYAYETTNHFAKLTAWLKASDQNQLSVLAYHDAIALLDGKTFVSERGGTWGRSHAMLEDLRREFPFTSRTNSTGLQSHIAAKGRIQLLLKENPEQKILHTVQVDRNGFIHAMLTGTPWENTGYEYFGARAYSQWIQAD